MKLHATVKIKSFHHCFVDLSQSLHWKLFNGTQNVPDDPQSILIESNGFHVICSWSGNLTKEEEDIIYLDRNLSSCNNIYESTEVNVSLLENMIYPAESVLFQTMEQTDYEILELNGTIIEKGLLNQIALVETGLIFPFYISATESILVKVVSTTPVKHIVRLLQFTEVHILPPSDESLTTMVHQSSSRHHHEVMDDEEIDILPEWFKKFATGLADTFLLSQPNLQMKADEGDKIVDKKIIENHVDTEIMVKTLPQSLCHINDSSSIELKTNSSPVPPYQVFLCENSNSECFLNREFSLAEISVSKSDNNEGAEEQAPSVKIVVLVKVLPKHVWIKFISNCNVLLANSILLEQLQLKDGSNVVLQCYHQSVEKLQGIVLHTSSTLDCDLFTSYLKTCLESFPRVVLNQGTLLKFQKVEEEGRYEVVVELIGILNSLCCVIDKESLENIFITVEKDDEEVITESADEINTKDIKEIGCMNDREPVIHTHHFNDVVDVLTTSFQSLNQYSAECKPALTSAHVNVLVYGASKATSSGCGKTFFAKAIKNKFSTAPHSFHVEFVNCLQFRGKKVETIREHWNTVYEKCYKYEPSLIIFDDLDEVIPNVDVVQDGFAMNLYSQRLCEIFQNFLLQIANENRMINTLTTISCKGTLHPCLLPEQNTYAFNHYTCLASSTSDQFAIVKDLVLNKVPKNLIQNGIFNNCCKVSSISEDDGKVSSSSQANADDIKTFRNKLEGFTPKDLNTIIQRTINKKMATNKQHDVSENSISISYSDFFETLEKYESPLMHGANLHKPKALSWNDIGGLQQAKELLKECLLWPAMYPELLSQCPIKLSSGVFLYGAPGTAKTMLASAVAYESQMNFISIKGPELLSKYVGSSETNVRDLFARAQSAKPCIIFFDELDSFAPRRGHDNTGVTDRVVNQLLTQLDGVESLDGVFVLAATSRPDLIDPALLRPGRFDKSILCDMPGENERLEILQILTKDVSLKMDVDLKYIAEITEHYSGADLKALLFNTQLENAHEVMKCIGTATTLEVSLCYDNFMSAYQLTQASVSKEERERFTRIFAEFGSSDVSKNRETTLPLQRVTLA